MRFRPSGDGVHIEGIQLLASNASAQDQLHRAGEAVQDVARTYSQIDDGAAGVFA